MQKNLDDVKYFLKAKKPESLQVLMIQNNIKTGKYHDYRIVFAEGFWFAWYEDSANDFLKKEVERVTNANRK